MGVDKATLVLEGEQLVEHAARVLDSACHPMLEVGPGVSEFDAVCEEPAGNGPLAAVAAGGAALAERGYQGPVVVLAVDLPFVTSALVRWLADHPSAASVVPRVDGHAQSLCARYSADALRIAAELVNAGERSMRALVAKIAVHIADQDEWRPIAVPAAFADVDTPEDAALAGIEVPGSLDPRE
jgi:molybdopterin-guanine dinucleotide biosynthesis protein A